MTDPTPPKVQEPFTPPFLIHHYEVFGQAREWYIADANQKWVTPVLSNEADALWLHKRLNAPAPASHGERDAMDAAHEYMARKYPEGHPDGIQAWWAAHEAYFDALQSRATLPGTQDARAAAEVADDVADIVQRYTQVALDCDIRDEMAAFLAARMSCATAPLTNSERLALVNARNRVFQDDLYGAQVTVDLLLAIITRLTTAEEKTE